jgi:hypothetical protein
MRRFLVVALYAAGLALLGTQANGATVSVSQTLDSYGPKDYASGASSPTEVWYFQNSYFSPAFGPTTTLDNFTGPAVTLNVGDTLDYSVSLLPGQESTVDQLFAVELGFGFAAIGSNDVTVTSTMQLLDDQGNIVLSGPPRAVTDLGGDAVYSDFSAHLPSLTFDTVKIQMHIDGFSNSSLGLHLTGAPFVQPILFIEGGDVIVPTFIGVPEPTTWAMAVLGFFGIGSTLRRRVLSAPAH